MDSTVAGNGTDDELSAASGFRGLGIIAGGWPFSALSDVSSSGRGKIDAGARFSVSDGLTAGVGTTGATSLSVRTAGSSVAAVPGTSVAITKVASVVGFCVGMGGFSTI